MTNNKSNIDTLVTGINQLQKQHPELDLDPSIFTFPFEDSEGWDIKILSINLFHDAEEAVCYWQILCCGSDAPKYAKVICNFGLSFSSLCHSLEGTRNGMDLFSITIISD